MSVGIKHKQDGGFTIVELLIVIVVIGILAALVLNTVVGVQQRAQAVAIADGFKKIEKALLLQITSEGASTWWDDEDLKGPDGESSIKYLIESEGLRDYLSEVPMVRGFDDTFYTYDNDQDEYDGCSELSTGVNIQTPFTDVPVATIVDEILDDGNLTCGKVRLDLSGELVYLLNRTEDVY